MNIRWIAIAIAIFFGSAALPASAADPIYKEGPVTEVWYIRTLPGKYEDYMRWVGNERKRELEGFKKAGMILSYAVYSTRPRTPEDPDLIITVTYPNMAALDNLHERGDPISKEVYGSMQSAQQDTVDREQVRRVIGSELIRELILQ